MAGLTGDSSDQALRLDFTRRMTLQFRGAAIASDAGLLAYRELDYARSLTARADETLSDARISKNGPSGLVGSLRQSVFGRLAGDEDVNDAGRLCRDPAMRWIVGDRASESAAASTSGMGRLETEWLTRPENVAALAYNLGNFMRTLAMPEAVEPRSPHFRGGCALDGDCGLAALVLVGAWFTVAPARRVVLSLSRLCVRATYKRDTPPITAQISAARTTHDNPSPSPGERPRPRRTCHAILDASRAS